MRRQVFLAFVGATLVGGALGAACTIEQPALECNFVSPYWAQYTLVSGTGSCSTFEADRIDFQRYLPPGETKTTFAFLSRRLGRITRVRGTLPRTDPSDPDHQKEAPRGTFPSSYPGADGFCTAESIVPAEQTLAEIDETVDLADGGTQVNVVAAATHVKDEWSNFKSLNNARFTGTIWTADVTVTRDACTATYKVEGVTPFVPCYTDEECNTNANPDAGRAVGSGISPDFKSTCKFYVAPTGYEASYGAAWIGAGAPVPGYCFPTVSIDDLAALK